jgi:uncharacterized protein (DUF433 family)
VNRRDYGKAEEIVAMPAIPGHPRITIDARILAGKPTIRGLRISVEQVLRALGSGESNEALLRDYPELEAADIAACQAYAADCVAAERVFPVAVG